MDETNNFTGKTQVPVRVDHIMGWMEAIRLQQRASTRKTNKIKRLKLTIKELEKLADDLYDALEQSHHDMMDVVKLLGPLPPDCPLMKEEKVLAAYADFMFKRAGFSPP